MTNFAAVGHRNGVKFFELAGHNAIAQEGMDIVADGFAGFPTTLWTTKLGLINNAGFVQVAFADTFSSHGNWVVYDDAGTPDWDIGLPVGGKVTPSPAVFSFTETVTIKGFYCFTSAPSNKLIATGTFITAITFNSGDTLTINYTMEST